MALSKEHVWTLVDSSIYKSNQYRSEKCLDWDKNIVINCIAIWLFVMIFITCLIASMKWQSLYWSKRRQFILNNMVFAISNTWNMILNQQVAQRVWLLLKIACQLCPVRLNLSVKLLFSVFNWCRFLCGHLRTNERWNNFSLCFRF